MFDSLLWLLPFAGMLLSIAVLPMVVPHFWHSNRNQLLVAVGWSIPVLGYLLFQIAGEHGHDASHSLAHAVEEYVSFIALLGSLYVISGGVLLTGDLEGKPTTNTAILAVGAVLANFIGTTGASMLLIRPMLRTNSERQYTSHLPIFFIFLVSNIGGALTPIGDPPLFLGYLRGVPFFWTLEHLWFIWLVPVGILLALFFVVDRHFYNKEDARHRSADRAAFQPLGMKGAFNLALLLGVVASVLLLSPNAEVQDFRHYYVREIAMFALAVASYKLTSREIHSANGFNFGPIKEVAALFAGIFLTMIPAALLLQVHGPSLGVDQTWEYFWATGILSSFLDNAPTYVTFAALACGSFAETCASPENLHGLALHAESIPVLVAISLGAVFMGANTYIGNGPNFMVKSIAEDMKYRMPSFFGYMAWSCGILVPIFILLTLIFFR
jgi:Na+/H+ antiporter NhaD/arsenite permease-like protein